MLVTYIVTIQDMSVTKNKRNLKHIENDEITK